MSSTRVAGDLDLCTHSLLDGGPGVDTVGSNIPTWRRAMGEWIHTSKVRMIRDKGPVRRAFIEHFAEPVYYGVHTAIARFYGVEPETEYPATLDHMIAAIGG